MAIFSVINLSHIYLRSTLLRIAAYGMKPQKFIALFCLVLSLVVGCQSGQGSGDIVSYSRDLEAVHQVYFGGIGELVVTQGDRDRLTVSAEDNLIHDFEIAVEDGSLVITLDDVPPEPTKPILFNLTVRELDRVELAGVGTINVPDLSASTFNVNVSGTGSLAISRLMAEQLIVNGSGAGRIEIAGQVMGQQVSLSGAGQYLASDLQSQSATIDLSGIGNAILWATNRLAINLSGAGSIQYYGTPNISRDVSGYGSIDYLGQNPT